MTMLLSAMWAKPPCEKMEVTHVQTNSGWAEERTKMAFHVGSREWMIGLNVPVRM